MSRGESWLMHGSNLLVGLTGLVYAWMVYLAEPADPEALVGHPWQPHVQHLHVLVAPLLVFAVGFVWQKHIWCHVRSGLRARRWSGLSMIGMLVPMVASGYLLQTAVDPTWRRVWVVVHVATSLLWVVSYLGHLAARWRRRAQRVPVADCAASPALHGQPAPGQRAAARSVNGSAAPGGIAVAAGSGTHPGRPVSLVG
jgi:hypothetical protein